MREKDYLKLIAIKCYDCCGYCPAVDVKLTNKDFKEAKENVESCNIKTCSLWEYRLLCKDPFKERQKKELSEEQKEKLRENIKKAQEARRLK